jgi:hypothetical protein
MYIYKFPTGSHNSTFPWIFLEPIDLFDVTFFKFYRLLLVYSYRRHSNISYTHTEPIHLAMSTIGTAWLIFSLCWKSGKFICDKHLSVTRIFTIEIF